MGEGRMREFHSSFIIAPFPNPPMQGEEKLAGVIAQAKPCEASPRSRLRPQNLNAKPESYLVPEADRISFSLVLFQDSEVEYPLE
jgi:hypothetical protein